MEKKTFWTVAVIGLAILVLLVVWQTSKINAISAGVDVARSTVSASANTAMVGGC